MSSHVSTSRQHQLTRPSGLGAAGWLLPVVLLLPAVVMSVVAVHELDQLYRSNAGVLRAEQLVPYPLGLHYVDLGHNHSPVNRARISAAHRRWQRLGERSADQAASTAWRESSGRVVVVVVAVSDDPRRSAAFLQGQARRGEQVRTWLEGDRVAIALSVSRATQRNAGPVLADRERSVRTSVRLQRAASLTAGAVLPVVALAIAFGVLFIAVAVIVVPALLLYMRVTAFFAGRPFDMQFLAKKARARKAEASRPVPLPSGVEVVKLPRWSRRSRIKVLRTVPLTVVALPAMTSSLWPDSLLWAGVIALALILSMRWTEGSPAARYLRRVLYLAMVLGLVNALFSWPTFPINDRGVLLSALVTTGVLVGLLAVHRRRQTFHQTGGGVLGARWVVFLVGFLAVSAPSVALFLGSNGALDSTGALDVRTQLTDKAIALLGLLLLPIGARRLRAAEASAFRAKMRREGTPAVLYLRSFVDDRLRVRSEHRLRDGLERWLPWPFERFEDVLLRGFERVGPVVAIGRPGTLQTELGAARDLVIGDDWVTAVTHKMDTVRFIAVVLGPGQGLHTELLTLCERQLLDRVCIVVPPVSPAEVAERLASGTAALAGAPGWGDIGSDAIVGRGEIVALVGIGARRVVMVARRRARASTYDSLALTVSKMVSEQEEQAPQPVTPQR